MKNDVTLIVPKEEVICQRITDIVEKIRTIYNVSVIENVIDLDKGPLKNKKVILALDIGNSGINIELYKILKHIRNAEDNFFENSVGGVIISGNNELFTRSIAREIIFTANLEGCIFPGKPLVEATGSLSNFINFIKDKEITVEEAFNSQAMELVERVCTFSLTKKNRPNILVLHASNYETSNTHQFWNMVAPNLSECKVVDIHIENGQVVDCTGCPYTMCLHYGKQNNCFYGGVMVEEIYPAILKCDSLVLLCPNYNDSVSANINAFINRLTALFRKTGFYKKSFFAVIVSGYSGSDIVATQLISALNINKSFVLPPQFASIHTANEPNSILKNEKIDIFAKIFAKNILETVKNH